MVNKTQGLAGGVENRGVHIDFSGFRGDINDILKTLFGDGETFFALSKSALMDYVNTLDEQTLGKMYFETAPSRNSQLSRIAIRDGVFVTFTFYLNVLRCLIQGAYPDFELEHISSLITKASSQAYMISGYRAGVKNILNKEKVG